jgi:NAD(P)-dependent dehydrogenase (short-subunit alcohol dehydrogenase family)
MPKTWFITGATRGLGLEIAKAALRAGDRVVATGRKRIAVAERLGPDSESLLSAELDVTDASQAKAAVEIAMSRFSGIDVLVNNAGYGLLGFFEEITLNDAEAQFATNFFGALNVTRAVLPVMRSARKGRIFNVSSLGGLMGVQFGSLYCATKFALEGFSESLAKEVAPFGILVTIVEPGPFRTDFLTPESLRHGDSRITDYDDRRAQLRAAYVDRGGLQPGDPAKLADALVRLANEPQPPMRFLAGTIAVQAADDKLAGMRAEIDHWRQLSVGTDGNYATADAEGLIAQSK